MALRVAQVERVDHHADVGGIFSRLAQMRDFDQLESGFMQIALEDLVAVEVAVGFLDDDVALEQEAFEDFLNFEAGVIGVERPEGDVLEVEEHGHCCIGILCTHVICERDCTTVVAAAQALLF